jgi:hypothetical protein
MIKFKLSATIPVVQYGNIQPSIELEGEDYSELEKQGMKYVRGLWDKYAERPLKENEVGEWKYIDTFTGETVQYNEETHKYRSEDGTMLVSGSAFAKKLEKPFDAAMIAGKVGAKHEVSPEEVASCWSDNGKLSRMFGSAVHKAMENWFRYKGVACDKEYNKPKHPFLNLVVDSFPLKDENVLPEVMVSSVKNRMVGQIDGLVVTGDKEGYIIDYKSDNDIKKNLKKHFYQLSFYAVILQKHGWSIERVEVWNYTDKWEKHESPILDLKTI